MRRVLVLLGSGFAASASPALADWQHTRWGMSVSEVVTSSAGEAAPVKGTDGDQVRGQDLGAEGTYDAGGLPLAILLFAYLRRTVSNTFAPGRSEGLPAVGTRNPRGLLC